MRIAPRSLAAVAGFLLLPGCKACNNDKPSVPYKIEGTPSSSSTSAPPPTAPPATASARPIDGGTFARVSAQQAPPGTSTWTLGGMAITAPPGRFFLSGLALQIPGQTAAAAFVGDGGSMAGEVVIYRAESGGRVVGPTTLAKLPDWLPVGQDCTHMPQLAQVGPGTLWLDVASVCQKAERKPNRYLAAISTSATPAIRADFRVSDPAPGERLAFDADGADRDSDGSDDLLVQIAIEGAPTPLTASTRTTTALKFFHRPAGMSRDPQEPAQSLRAQATWQASQAAKRDTADAALMQSRQLRRLMMALCSESGAPVIQSGDGAPISCGDTTAAAEARHAEARAYVSLGNLPVAFALAARLRDASASTKAKPQQLASLDAAIEAVAPARKVNARPLKVIPRSGEVALPISFDASGALLVLSDDGVVRVDPATGDEAPAPQAARWNPIAELVGDLKVRDGGDDCKASFLSFNVKAGGSVRPLLTSIPGSSGPGCAASLPLALLDRNAEGLTALLQGEPVSVSSDGEKAQVVAWPQTPGGQGSLRSPDGRWSALTSSDRVLLRGPDRSEVWKPASRFFFTACTAANDGKAAACLLERGVVLLTP